MDHNWSFWLIQFQQLLCPEHENISFHSCLLATANQSLQSICIWANIMPHGFQETTLLHHTWSMWRLSFIPKLYATIMDIEGFVISILSPSAFMLKKLVESSVSQLELCVCNTCFMGGAHIKHIIRKDPWNLNCQPKFPQFIWLGLFTHSPPYYLNKSLICTSGMTWFTWLSASDLGVVLFEIGWTTMCSTVILPAAACICKMHYTQTPLDEQEK